MIAVDTSVWIDYFADRQAPHVAILDSYLERNPSEVALVDIVLTELLQGIVPGERADRVHQILTAEMPEALGFMQKAVKEFGATIVMVTHDPLAASYSDRVVFLVDGRVVDELQDPRTDTVLDKMRNLGQV